MLFWPDDAQREENACLLAMNIISQPSISTINKRNEITRLFKEGKKVHTIFGPVFLMKTKDTDKRTAILVKSKLGNAVYRNKLKRRVRHFIRTHITLFDKYNRVIFLLKAEQENSASYEKIKTEFELRLNLG